ncbi:MAG TPA: hypothetical protein VEO01_36995 [Pseudonocardiaceae bacterium]|nr:hypothetical protein [Pseudonocardiaceae bacterium]
MGVGQARNRLPKAVQRTVPFGMLVQSLVIVWYTLSGYHPDDVAARRQAEPWYEPRPSLHSKTCSPSSARP